MYQDQSIVVAVRNDEDVVMTPLLSKSLGMNCKVGMGTTILSEDEVYPESELIEVARRKCYAAMEKFNIDLSIASAAAFIHDEKIYNSYLHKELMLFCDRARGMEMSVTEITSQTNYTSVELTNVKQLQEFTETCGFPEHALNVVVVNGKTEIMRGLNNWKHLALNFNKAIKEKGIAQVYTDMRAANNPSRMKVIRSLTYKLIEKIKTACPQCQSPGFTVTQVKKGLPCEVCKRPTQSDLIHECTCTTCGYSREKKYPKGKRLENPLYCLHCNPR